MKKIALIAFASLFTLSAHAGDIEAGKAKSMLCAACHGADGISLAPIYPNLKGQKAQYIEKQLKAFKEGTRQDPVMAPMAMPLTDEDIANLAAYYESLK
ncbi:MULTISPECIES: c-type cytochrome [Shewanella]|uniref:c-type cytochrome n=1 Tax=Shewanella TaxID=22 RepID=UPI001EFC8FD2|nr:MULTISPECIES: cytochrome c [Shewanella]MCG9748702.1 cytochrome c [Shewanella sp. Isolate8]MCL2909878.1 cytochrome c [Shewanella aquimarina]